ncbi:MAG: hypothetical protein AABN95_07430 [Acidobacteriota bacterium]
MPISISTNRRSTIPSGITIAALSETVIKNQPLLLTGLILAGSLVGLLAWKGPQIFRWHQSAVGSANYWTVFEDGSGQARGALERFPPGVSDQLVRYPSAAVAFICGPQLKSGSAANPFPWFDSTQSTKGLAHGKANPRIPPFGPMFVNSITKQWENVIRGRVSVDRGSKTVHGSGTAFTTDVDPQGPAPLFDGHFRIGAGGTERAVKVSSVDSDTQLTLSAPWPFDSVTRVLADTYYQNNTDHYYSDNYYDLALVQYINYYRTQDARFLSYARKTADAWWHSQYIADGTVTSGPNRLPPRSMAFAGLMLRALDGRPEMWDYLEREVRANFDGWVYTRKAYPTIYYDTREDGYAQLYAVMMAKVLPDRYLRFANGTLSASTGTVADGAAKRAAYLAQTEDTAINFFGRLQRPDGSWRWDVDLAPDPANQFRNTEQPFLTATYLEAAVLLHMLTQREQVKTGLKNQITRAAERYGRNCFDRSIVTDFPQYRWRAMHYWCGGGVVSNPTLLEKPKPHGSANGDLGTVRQARHLNSTLHQLYGHAYALTLDPKFKEWGDELFGASFGDQQDQVRAQADGDKGKDYAMNYRASGRYLVWRLITPQGQSSATIYQSTATKLQDTTRSPPDVALQHAAPTSMELISGALSLARQLSISLATKEQVEDLIGRIELAQQAFNSEKQVFVDPKNVMEELDAALRHARITLSVAGSESGGYESTRLRVGWVAARLKRANDRLKPK